MHYHEVCNVSGYLPAAYPYATFAGAASGLDNSLSIEQDDEESDERVDELQKVRDMLDLAAKDPSSTDFLMHTSAHAPAEHDITTTWQVTTCTDLECGDEREWYLRSRDPESPLHL